MRGKRGSAHRILPTYPTPTRGRVLGPSANNPLGDWSYHEVVVKDGMVYDGFTGMSINDFKSQFDFGDAINFGF